MFGYSNPIVQEDMELMAKTPSAWHKLNNKTVLVAGATGMLATYITYFLCYIHKECGVNVRVVALCRTKSKADSLFSVFYSESWFKLILQDICEPIQCLGRIDYIFHLAGNASPYFIKNDPVGIVKSNLIGTYNILELARDKEPEKIVFASTREVYGKTEVVNMLTEDDYGCVNPLEDRACYPESKRAAETMFRSYSLQYGINFNSVRIAHSYGPGMRLANDGRVMADLMNNVINGENIVLKSDGTAERAFIYITDAVLAMFTVLFSGEKGMAYNVANETEPIAIRDLAAMMVSLRKDKQLKVVFDIPKEKSSAYTNYKRSGLDTKKLESIGWKPVVTLKDGVVKTINSMK